MVTFFSFEKYSFSYGHSFITAGYSSSGSGWASFSPETTRWNSRRPYVFVPGCWWGKAWSTKCQQGNCNFSYKTSYHTCKCLNCVSFWLSIGRNWYSWSHCSWDFRAGNNLLMLNICFLRKGLSLNIYNLLTERKTNRGEPQEHLARRLKGNVNFIGTSCIKDASSSFLKMTCL